MTHKHSTPGLLPPPLSVVIDGDAGIQVPRSTNKLVPFVLAFSTLVTMAAGQDAATTAAGQDVLTSRNNLLRTGMQQYETILTPANVHSSSFGFLRSLNVDGQVYAQPLYVSAAQVFVNGVSQGTKNLLYVATEHDSIYCFDADSGTLYWQRSVLLPGETPANDLGCPSITPENGITGTPVIDRKAGPNGTIYAVSMSLTPSRTYTYRLNALDLATGNTVKGPTTITASVPGRNGVFRPDRERPRPGLALANGNIYIGFGSICDAGPFTGWMLAYSQQSLAQVSVFNTNPTGNGPHPSGSTGPSGAGIWQSGIAPVIAPGSPGSLIFATGNGPFSPPDGSYGYTVLRLNPTVNPMTVADSFTPWNLAPNTGDADLGSGGGIRFHEKGLHLFAIAGKNSTIYLLDMTQKWAQFNGSNNSYIYQELDGVLYGGEFGNPAFFYNSLYYGPQRGPLLQFTFNASAKLSSQPTSRSPETFGAPGTTPSISANGSTGAIVWAIEKSSSGQAVLHAYDPNNLANELFKSANNFGSGIKFSVPTIAGGRVFVGTGATTQSPGSVGVFGLH